MSAHVTHRRPDPSAYVSPADEAQEEAEGIAEKIAMLATEIGEEASEISARAGRGSWRWPYGRAALEALLQDMATMKARLEHIKDMG
jgi:hypothetical protein